MNDEKNSEVEVKPFSKKTPGGKVGSGLKAYLSDWRNWVTHGLVGIVLLALALWAPVSIWFKLLVFAGIVGFNIFRMRRKSQKNQKSGD